MNREIKFRAWDNFNECYYNSDEDRFPHLAAFFLHVKFCEEGGNGITLEQYTGLKDKNGVEIYEGEGSVKLIIKGCGEGIADIVMHEGKWCVFEQSQGFAPLFDLLNGNSTEIHSNPELLITEK